MPLQTILSDLSLLVTHSLTHSLTHSFRKSQEKQLQFYSGLQLLPKVILMLHTLLFLSFICALALCHLNQAEGYDILSENSDSTEQDCLQLLASDTFDPTTLNAKFVGFAMKRGFWKCAKELSNMANSLRIDVRSVFDMESRTIAKELKEIKSAIESTLPVSTIAPAFQWAQSPTEIFISVKFAHKLDAPATLNVEAETVNITETDLVLKATDGRKIFNLNVEL